MATAPTQSKGLSILRGIEQGLIPIGEGTLAVVEQAAMVALKAYMDHLTGYLVAAQVQPPALTDGSTV